MSSYVRLNSNMSFTATDVKDSVQELAIAEIDTLNIDEASSKVSGASIFEEGFTSQNLTKLKEDDDWVDVEPKVNKSFIFFDDGYIYTTSDGTTIKLSDTEGVRILENKQTGEIIVIGAKDTTIETKNENSSVYIYDSEISSLETGKGNDKVYVEKSTVNGCFDTGSGDDTVKVVNSVVNPTLKTGSGNDNITISGSNVNLINSGDDNDKITLNDDTKVIDIDGGSGNDQFIVDNSEVTGTISGGAYLGWGGAIQDDDTFIIRNGSKINNLNADSGNDDVTILNSTVTGKIDGNGGDDVITVKNSTTGEIDVGKDNDTVNITNSTTGLIDGASGTDSVVIKNSTTDKVKAFEHVAVDNPDTPIDSSKEPEVIQDIDMTCEYNYDTLDDDGVTTALSVAEDIASKYTDRELSEEEQIQVMALDYFSQNLEQMTAQFQDQNSSDGAISQAYNFIKQLTDLGVSKEDIQKAIDEQTQMVEEMKKAINQEGELTFEEVFEKYTGVKYNKENLQKYLESAQIYSIATSGLNKTLTFEENVKKANSLGDVFDLYKSYFGTEERAREELNKFLQEVIPNHPEEFVGIISVEINENNEFVVQRSDSKGPYGDYPQDSVYTTVDDIYEVTNMIRTMPRNFDLDTYTQNFKQKFQDTFGYSIETLQNNYISDQSTAFGRGCAFQKLVDKYCADQEGFIDKLASVTQIAGIGLMVVGGIVSIVFPPAGAVGLSMISTGQYAALAGMFGDNILETIDITSSEDFQKALEGDEEMSQEVKEKLFAQFKETVVEIALLYSGAKINGVASNVKDIVLTQTQSQVLSIMAEIGTDASLSLLTDLMITGDLDLTGEGLSQLLGIITGIAGAKVSAFKQKALADADVLYKTEGYDVALDKLKSQGFPESEIISHYGDLEMQKVQDIYKQTGSLTQALKAVGDSRVLCGCATSADGITKQNVINIINNLVDRNALPQGVDFLKILNSPGSVSQDLYSDLLKYKNALDNNISIKDAFVPTYASSSSASYYAPVGEVFTLYDTGQLAIKTSSGKIQTLNISAETYLKLFPPVSRYATCQQNIGDCFLVSTIDNLYKTPESRIKLLECFTEDAQGNVKVKVGDVSMTYPNGYFSNRSYITEPYSSGSYYYKYNVEGCDGMKMLEEAFGFAYREQKIADLKREIRMSKAGTKEYQEAVEDLAKLTDDSNFSDFGTIARDHGGYIDEAYKLFGLKAQYINNVFGIVDAYLKNPKKWEKYMFSAGTKGTSDTLMLDASKDLAQNHAYNIQPFYNSNGEIMIRVTNPWHCGTNVELTLAEFNRYFSDLTIVEKP